MAIPGPNEPLLEDMNNITEPFVFDMLELGKGMFQVAE